MPQLVPSAAAVRDTLAAIFRQPEYERSLRDTLWSRLSSWFSGMLDRLLTVTGDSPALAWTLRLAVVLALVFLVARLAYVAWAGRPQRVAWNGLSGAGNSPENPWRRAGAEAAAGNYTEAAHLLYAGLLHALSSREKLRLHPAKTVGDYTRELRSRSSGALGGFREFGRNYETVVYGDELCDRDRYEKLFTLASSLVAPDG